jgi:hypothetical protein
MSACVRQLAGSRTDVIYHKVDCRIAHNHWPVHIGSNISIATRFLELAQFLILDWVVMLNVPAWELPSKQGPNFHSTRASGVARNQGLTWQEVKKLSIYP